MNLFTLLRTEAGNLELVTSPLTSGIILPGVTRRSIIEMVSTWPGITVSERKITMGEVVAALAEGRLVEMFGSGTAAVVSQVGGLHYNDRLLELPTPSDGLAVQVLAAMNDIYYGRVAHPWAVDVEDWNIDINQVMAILFCFEPICKMSFLPLTFAPGSCSAFLFKIGVGSKVALGTGTRY